MSKIHSDITLEVNLDAIKHNYDVLRVTAGSATCAAVVKANAYGLGVNKVAPLLYLCGCRDFFVATADEAVELARIVAPDARIYVFHGVKKGEENDLAANNIIPVINDVYQLECWMHKAKTEGLSLPCVLHFDTGMNRLGFNWADAKKISMNEALRFLDVKYVMSHLSCADEPDNDQNNIQLKRMNEVRKIFPKARVSLANSWGILAAKCYHFDLVRPGCSLYGVKGKAKVDIKNIITAKAKILQIREVSEDGFVGYGATVPVKAGTRLAVVPLGYADGYLRSLSNNSYANWKGGEIKLLGRVSMDLTIFDITHLPKVQVGDEIELIGDAHTVDQVADDAGTIGYEILTSLGKRYNRVYKS